MYLHVHTLVITGITSIVSLNWSCQLYINYICICKIYGLESFLRKVAFTSRKNEATLIDEN